MGVRRVVRGRSSKGRRATKHVTRKMTKVGKGRLVRRRKGRSRAIKTSLARSQGFLDDDDDDSRGQWADQGQTEDW